MQEGVFARLSAQTTELASQSAKVHEGNYFSSKTMWGHPWGPISRHSLALSEWRFLLGYRSGDPEINLMPLGGDFGTDFDPLYLSTKVSYLALPMEGSRDDCEEGPDMSYKQLNPKMA